MKVLKYPWAHMLGLPSLYPSLSRTWNPHISLYYLFPHLLPLFLSLSQEAKVRECLGDRRRRGELDAGWEWWIVEGDELLLDIICHSPLGIGALLWVWRIHTVHAAACKQRGRGAQTMHRHGSKQSHGEDGLHSPRVCDYDEDSQRVTIQLPTMGLESGDATSGGDLRSRAKDDSYHNPQAPCKEEVGAVTGQRRRWW